MYVDIAGTFRTRGGFFIGRLYVFAFSGPRPVLIPCLLRVQLYRVFPLVFTTNSAEWAACELVGLNLW